MQAAPGSKAAGAAVQHLTREITDPAGHSPGRGGSDIGPHAAILLHSTPDLPPEVVRRPSSKCSHRHYANWADETIPVWMDARRVRPSPPRRVWRVKGLLREYEEGERQ